MVRDNGRLVVPDGLECASLVVGVSVTPLAARLYPAHHYRRAVIQTNQPVRWTASPDPDNDPSTAFGILLDIGDTLALADDIILALNGKFIHPKGHMATILLNRFDVY